MEDKNAQDIVLREAINAAVRTESIFKLYAYRVITPNEFISEMMYYTTSLNRVYEEQKKAQAAKDIESGINGQG